MLLFLATVVEQLDVALEHVVKRDVHNARFSLMLTDNVVELVLHQIAKDQAAELKHWSHLRDNFQHNKELDEALRRSFEAKIKFAKLQEKLDEDLAQTISILHTYRNEVYHIGLQHEAILPVLAVFHFDVVSRFVQRYEPRGLGWSSNMRMPERAKKYFKGDKFFPGSEGDFENSCIALAAACTHDAGQMISVLTDRMDEVVQDTNTCIDIVAGGVYDNQKTTRETAIIDTQAWKIAFREEAKTFARAQNWSGGNFPAFIEWLGKNYPFKYRKDPIPSWQKRTESLRSESDPHKALNRYYSFMEETGEIREALTETAMLVENEIQSLIDRARGK